MRSGAATGYSWLRPPWSSELTPLAPSHSAQTINECEVQRAAAAAGIVQNNSQQIGWDPLHLPSQRPVWTGSQSNAAVLHEAIQSEGKVVILLLQRQKKKKKK